MRLLFTATRGSTRSSRCVAPQSGKEPQSRHKVAKKHKLREARALRAAPRRRARAGLAGRLCALAAAAGPRRARLADGRSSCDDAARDARQAAKLGSSGHVRLRRAHTRAVRADELRPPFPADLALPRRQPARVPARDRLRRCCDEQTRASRRPSTRARARAWRTPRAGAPRRRRARLQDSLQTFLNDALQLDAQRAGADRRARGLQRRLRKVRWRTPLGPSESSPVIAGHTVYVGDWKGT